MSNLTKEGHWAKALEVYEALDAVGVRPDTTITNAAISSCDKGGQWEAALALFRRMTDLGMARWGVRRRAQQRVQMGQTRCGHGIP